MSVRTRIKRPTTATPRKVGTRRYVHVSTNYGWRPTNPLRPEMGGSFVKLGRGTTYLKAEGFQR
jgi:hypothetical protein